MLVQISDVLKPDQLQLVDALLSDAAFTDGRQTAGATARAVKDNEELTADAPDLERLNNIVMNALVQHPVYRAAAMPLRIAAPLYVRYRPGMAYGEHIDDPLMRGPTPYRSDIAITVFLNAPEDYDGGELEITTDFGSHTAKLPAGAAVLYPASSLHRVNEVLRGERRVAVTWVQSAVRDPARRAILYDLHQAREHLLGEHPTRPTTRRVDHAYVNLVRMWSDL